MDSEIRDRHIPTLFECEAIRSFFCNTGKLGGFEDDLSHLDWLAGGIWCWRRRRLR